MTMEETSKSHERRKKNNQAPGRALRLPLAEAIARPGRSEPRPPHTPAAAQASSRAAYHSSCTGQEQEEAAGARTPHVMTEAPRAAARHGFARAAAGFRKPLRHSS
jgi:hypothetical protein